MKENGLIYVHNVVRSEAYARRNAIRSWVCAEM